MRKTRSQTQAENAVLSGSAKSSSRSGVSSSTSSTNHPHQQSQQQQMNPGNPQKRSAQAPSNLNYIDPAILKECEEMISVLRVVELHKILSYLNINFAGRKVDYQRRILGFLRTNFDLVAPKVREVYTQSFVEQQANQYGPPDPKRMYSQMQMQPNAAGMVGSNAAAQMGTAQQILNPASQAGMQAGVPPGNNVVPLFHAIPTQMPIHPDVRLKKLAFYDVLGTLIKPSSLVPRNAQRIQEVPFYFTLTPQQATEIASNRDIRNSSKIEHAIQVQLRFCLLETSCDQEDCFPPSVSVKVNNKLCQLPNVIPTNRPNVEPKRPPRPVNVTSNVKLSPTVTNTITVQWCPDYTRGYCIAVYLVKKLTSAQLLQRMKQKGVKPADYTRALIKEKLTEDADCEIATTMLKVSLNCPLGKMKMSIPCRASTCSHLQCFDASLYLQMNERKPTWNCPVCDKPAVYDNLVIDGYFQEVLASNLLKPDDTEIQLHKDGSWSTHSLRNEGQIIDTPTKPVEKVEVISDDIELITTEDVKPIKAAASASVNTSEQPSSTTNSETVDLTLSDSDDDLPLAKRRPIAKQNANSGQPSSTINGNASAGNQRGGMYMQQKNVVKFTTNKSKPFTNSTSSSLPINSNNDDEIISLDSPSPPASPQPFTDNVLHFGSSFHNRTKTISTSPANITTTTNHNQKITVVTLEENEFLELLAVKGECFSEDVPNEDNISCDSFNSEDLIPPFSTTINRDGANAREKLNISEVSAFIPSENISRDSFNYEGLSSPFCTSINNKGNAGQNLKISEVSSCIPNDNISRDSFNVENLTQPLCTSINNEESAGNNLKISKVSSLIPNDNNTSRDGLNYEDLLPVSYITINDEANARENLKISEVSSRFPNLNGTPRDRFNCEDLTSPVCTSINNEGNTSKNLNISEVSSLDAQSSVNFNSLELPSSLNIIMEHEDSHFEEMAVLIETISIDEPISSEIYNHHTLSPLNTTTNFKTITFEGVSFKELTSPFETIKNGGGDKTNFSEKLYCNESTTSLETTVKPSNKEAIANCYNKPTSLANEVTNDEANARETFHENASSVDRTNSNLNASKIFNHNAKLLSLDKATVNTANTSERSINREESLLVDNNSNDKTTFKEKENVSFLYAMANGIQMDKEVASTSKGETQTSNEGTLPLNKKTNRVSIASNIMVNNKDSMAFDILTNGDRITSHRLNHNRKNMFLKQLLHCIASTTETTTHKAIEVALGDISNNETNSGKNSNNKVTTSFSNAMRKCNQNVSETFNNQTTPILEIINDEIINVEKSNEKTLSSSAEISEISSTSLNCNKVSSSLETTKSDEISSKANLNCNEVTSTLDIRTTDAQSLSYKESNSLLDIDVIADNERSQANLSCSEVTSTFDSTTTKTKESLHHIEPVTQDKIVKNLTNIGDIPTSLDKEKNIERLSSENFISAKSLETHLDITQLKIPCSDKTKKHFCIFCKTLQTKISRHFLLKHRKEEKVRAILKLPKKHKKRMKIINQLRKEGDFLHNTSNSWNTGMLIVSRQQQVNRKNDVNHYAGCKKCKGYFSKDTLRIHLNKCGQTNDATETTNKAFNQKSDKSMEQSSSNLSKVSIPYSSKTKQHFCIFCKRLQTKLPRHFLLKHRSEERIKAIVNLPNMHKDRLKVFNQLRKEGDFLHNTTKSLNTGMLIVSRQQMAKMKKNVDDYACCKYCKGFFSRQTLRRHLGRCNKNNKKNDRTNIIASRRLTQYLHEAASEKLKTEIFPLLRLDAVTKTIRYDELIIKYGNKLAEKYKLKEQHDQIRSQLRSLGRFKIMLKKLCPEIEELKEIFQPQMINKCVKALRKATNWISDSKGFKIPNTAYNLYLLIKKCGMLQKSEFNEMNNDFFMKNLDEFLSLWNKKIPKLVKNGSRKEKLNGCESDASGESYKRNSNKEIHERDLKSNDNSVKAGDNNQNVGGKENEEKDAKKNKEIYTKHSKKEISKRDLSYFEINSSDTSGEESESEQENDKMENDSNFKEQKKSKELTRNENTDKNIMPDLSQTTKKTLTQTNAGAETMNKTLFQKSDRSMDQISSFLDVSKISIPYSSKTKQHFCIFCKTLQTRLPRHFLLKHRSEERIKAIVNLPNKHKDRLKVFNQLRKEGGFLHNTTKSLNTGMLIVSRRQMAKMKKDVDDYACCKYCKGFFSRQTLKGHLGRCNKNYKKNDRTNLIASRRLTQYLHEAASEKLKTEIFPLLRVDAVTKIIRYDELIIKYGNKLAEKYKLTEQHVQIRSQLRSLGRFKIMLKKLCPEIEELKEIFQPQMIDKCVKALRKATNWISDSKGFKMPNTAYNLYLLIKKCGMLQKSELNEMHNDFLIKNLDEFLSLWNKEIPKLVKNWFRKDLVSDKKKLNGCESDVSERDLNSNDNSVKTGQTNQHVCGEKNAEKDAKKNKETYTKHSKKVISKRDLTSIEMNNSDTSGEESESEQENDKMEKDSNFKELKKTKELTRKENTDNNIMPDLSQTTKKNLTQKNVETETMNKTFLQKSDRSMDQITSILDVSKISIPYSSKTKQHFCIFCKTLQTRLPRHFLLKHRSEERIKAIVNLPNKHKDRLKVFNQLRKEGDFLHNTTKSFNTGMLIVSRQQMAKMKKNVDDYACCKYCKGFFSKQTLRGHLGKCNKIYKKNDRTNIIASRRLTQYLHEAASEKLKTEIFPQLRVDAVTKIIRYDELIIKYGNKLAEKYKLTEQHDQIRSQLRSLGRFKIMLKKLCPEIEELKEIFQPHMIDKCVKALRKATNWISDSKGFKMPNTAYNLYLVIKKCGLLQKSELNEMHNDFLMKNLDEFLSLWNKEIPKLVKNWFRKDLISDKENGESDASEESNKRNSNKEVYERDSNSNDENNHYVSGEENAEKDAKKNKEIHTKHSKKEISKRYLRSIEINNSDTSGDESESEQEKDRNKEMSKLVENGSSKDLVRDKEKLNGCGSEGSGESYKRNSKKQIQKGDLNSNDSSVKTDNNNKDKDSTKNTTESISTKEILLYTKYSKKEISKRDSIAIEINNSDTSGEESESEQKKDEMEKNSNFKELKKTKELTRKENYIIPDLSQTTKKTLTQTNDETETMNTTFFQKSDRSMDQITSNLDVSKISVPYSSKAKQHFCIFCKTLQTKMPRHFLTKHRSEERIKAIVKLPKMHKERLKVLNQLRKEGDFLHNTKKLHNTGMLIVSRQQMMKMKKKADDYACCKYCKGFFSRQCLRCHLGRCNKNYKKNDRSNLIASNRLTQYLHEAASEKLKTEIFPLLRVDAVTKIIRYDELIIKFGNHMAAKRNDIKLYESVRFHLRLLGRFKLAIKKLCPQVEQLHHVFKPHMVNDCRKAFCKTASWDNDLMYFKTPSTAQYLSSVIKKCGKLLRKEFQKLQQFESEKILDAFFSKWEKVVGKLVYKNADSTDDENLVTEQDSKERAADDVREKAKNDLTNIIASNRPTQYLHEAASEKLKTQVFPLLRVDAVTKIIRYDELIIKFGNHMSAKRNDIKLYQSVRFHLRLLGRFKLAIKKLCPQVEQLHNIFKPHMVNDCKKAFCKTASWDNELMYFKTPSTAQYLSSVIKKCGKLLRKEFQKLQQFESEKILDAFFSKWEKVLGKLVCKNSDSTDDEDVVTQQESEVLPSDDVSEKANEIINAAGSDEDSNSDASEESYRPEKIRPRKRKRIRKEKSPLRSTRIKRIRWTQEEQDAITSVFGCPNKLQKLPSLKECTEVINKFPELKRRTPPQIKSWIDNQRSKKQIYTKNKRDTDEDDYCSDATDKSSISEEMTKTRRISQRGKGKIEENSSDCSKIKRLRWSQEEQDAISSIFGCLKSLAKLPSLMECTDAINKTPVLMNRTAPQLKSWIDNQRRYK